MAWVAHSSAGSLRHDLALTESLRCAPASRKLSQLVLDIGLYGISGGVIRQWLDELLPEDAAQRCEGRVELLVTALSPGRLVPTVELPKMRALAVSDFADRAALIDANLASVHAHVESKLAQV